VSAALLVVLGGAVGAPLRYLVDRVLRVRYGAALPWGTFAVNVAGSLLLGLTVGAAVPPALAAAVGTGFCGALTTYSTFAAETVDLAERGRRGAAALVAIGSMTACLAAAAAGLTVGAGLAG
jgi:CrcB protein